MIKPPILRSGDLVYLTAPAKAIGADTVLRAKKTLEGWGLTVLVSPHCTGQFHYFSGTDAERLSDVQWGLDHPEIKAIICARGGYGCARIVNDLHWEGFVKNPKWIVGFSDITVFHQKIQGLGIESIHGIMPLGFCEGTEEAKETLRKALFGQAYTTTYPTGPLDKLGEAEGMLVGGNMAIVCSLIGTPLAVPFKGNLLFLEDVGEHVYKIDRMLQTLQMVGAFRDIKGLILGGFTAMEDTTVPFGQTVTALIQSQAKAHSYPVAFDFPAGHLEDNRALVLGRTVRFSVTQSAVSLTI